MTKASCRYLIQMSFTLVLLLVPASSRELQRDTPQQPSPQNARPVDAQDEQAAEQSLWDSIKDGSDPQAYQTFLGKFPRGYFAGKARSRLRELLGEDFVTLFMKRIDAGKRWSTVEEQLERRARLVPKLYETLVAAGFQEQEFFGQMAEWRSRLLNATKATPEGAGDAKTADQRRAVIAADNGLGKTLRQLGPLLEHYPQLRSNERVIQLQDELTGVENRIAVARVDYNRAALDYNTLRNEPRMARLAERYGLTEEPYFKSEQEEWPAEPKVNSLLPVSTHNARAGVANPARQQIRCS